MIEAYNPLCCRPGPFYRLEIDKAVVEKIERECLRFQAWVTPEILAQKISVGLSIPGFTPEFLVPVWLNFTGSVATPKLSCFTNRYWLSEKGIT